MKRSAPTRERHLELARKRTAALDVYADDGAGGVCYMAMLDDPVLMQVLGHAIRITPRMTMSERARSHQARRAIALVCLRFYYVQRSMSRMISFSVPRDCVLRSFNELVMQNERLDEWQAAGSVWTVRDKLMAVSIQLGRNTLETDLRRSKTRRLLPFYYLRRVTTPAQRANSILVLNDPYSSENVDMARRRDSWGREAVSLFTLMDKPDPVAMDILCSFSVVDFVYNCQLVKFLMWAAEHKFQWPEKKPVLTCLKRPFNVCSAGTPDVMAYAREQRLIYGYWNAQVLQIVHRNHTTISKDELCPVCGDRGTPFALRRFVRSRVP